MPTDFPKLSNNATGFVGPAGYTAGSHVLNLRAGGGANFPALEDGEWFPVTVIRAAVAYSPSATDADYTIFKVTGVAGDAFTLDPTPLDGTADRNYAAGSVVQVRASEGTFSGIHAAVNANEAAVSGLNSLAVKTTSTYANPPWISSLSQGKISGLTGDLAAKAPVVAPTFTDTITSEGSGSNRLRERFDANGNLVQTIESDGRQKVTVNVPGDANLAAFSIETGEDHSGPCFDFRKRKSGGNFGGWRYYSPFLEDDPVTMLVENGGLSSRMQVKLSSVTTGTGGNYDIVGPTNDDYWIGMWMDIRVGIQIRDSGLAGSLAFEVVDVPGHYRQGISASTGDYLLGDTAAKDGDGRPLFDVNLGRESAGILRLKSGFVIAAPKLWAWTDAAHHGGINRAAASNALVLENVVVETVAGIVGVVFNGSSQNGFWDPIGLATNVFSASLWFEPAASDAAQMLLYMQPFALARNMAGPGAYMWYTAGVGPILTIPNLLDGTRHHILAVSTGTIINLYVDGALAGTKSYVAPAITDGDYKLASYASGFNAAGKCSGLSIWNRALTAQDALDLFGGGTPPPSGLVANWPMTDGSGTSLTDTVAGHDITLNGSPTWTTAAVPQLVTATSVKSRDSGVTGVRGIHTFGDAQGKTELVGSTIAISTPNAAPTDSQIGAGQVVLSLDEAGNKLEFRVRYSDGTTLKTGEMDLS